MIHIFNRKELCVTMDMQRQTKIRDILHANNIEYDLKTTNLASSSSIPGGRGRTYTSDFNIKHSYEYKFYVKKEDYEKALHLIGGRK